MAKPHARRPSAPGCTMPLSLRWRQGGKSPSRFQKLLQLDPAGASAKGVALNRTVQGAPMAQQHRRNLRESPAHPLVARTSSSRKPLFEISDSKRSSK